MAYGNYEGKELSNPELRKYFDRDVVLQSKWYNDRLKLKQTKDSVFLEKEIQYLEDFMANPNNQVLIEEMQIKHQIDKANKQLKSVKSVKYLEDLVGTIGADPLFIKK